jgi:hypothetical protein
MKALIETIARSLVDHPQDVKVTEQEREDAVVYRLTVNPSDVGKVIGKQGKIAKAMRTVVYAAGAKGNRRIYLDID